MAITDVFPRFSPGQICKFEFRQGMFETYYSPQGEETVSVYSWCLDTFGPTGAVLDEAVPRWEHYRGWIRFREEADVLLFTLRWR